MSETVKANDPARALNYSLSGRGLRLSGPAQQYLQQASGQLSADDNPREISRQIKRIHDISIQPRHHNVDLAEVQLGLKLYLDERR